VTETTTKNEIEKRQYNMQKNNTVISSSLVRKYVFLDYIVIRGILKSIIKARIHNMFLPCMCPMLEPNSLFVVIVI
jgi:hypothetical protein